jgi:hypothetical protein
LAHTFQVFGSLIKVIVIVLHFSVGADGLVSI